MLRQRVHVGGFLLGEILSDCCCYRHTISLAIHLNSRQCFILCGGMRKLRSSCLKSFQCHFPRDFVSLKMSFYSFLEFSSTTLPLRRQSPEIRRLTIISTSIRKRGICLHSITTLFFRFLLRPPGGTYSIIHFHVHYELLFLLAQKWPFIASTLYCSKPFNKLFICAGVSYFGLFQPFETLSICLSRYDGILLGNWILGVTFLCVHIAFVLAPETVLFFPRERGNRCLGLWWLFTSLLHFDVMATTRDDKIYQFLMKLNNTKRMCYHEDSSFMFAGSLTTLLSLENMAAWMEWKVNGVLYSESACFVWKARRNLEQKGTNQFLDSKKFWFLLVSAFGSWQKWRAGGWFENDVSSFKCLKVQPLVQSPDTTSKHSPFESRQPFFLIPVSESSNQNAVAERIVLKPEIYLVCFLFLFPKQKERNIKNVIILDRSKPSIESAAHKKKRLNPFLSWSNPKCGQKPCRTQKERKTQKIWIKN